MSLAAANAFDLPTEELLYEQLKHNFWFPVAYSADVGDAPMQVFLCDEQLVLVRPVGKLLAMTVLRYAAQVKAADEFEELVIAAKTGAKQLAAARQVIGATNPLEAAPGSIRGDFGLEVQTNLVHGSDSPESAARESALFFPEL